MTPKKNSIPNILLKLGQLWQQMTTRLVAMEAATIHHLQKTRNRWITLIVWYFVAGLLLFHVEADFSKMSWQNAYYLWQKSLDLLFFLILYSIVPNGRSVFIPVIFYSIVRLCFQVITIIAKTDTNDQRIVNTLYLILLGIFIYQSIKEIRKEWYQK